MVKLSRRGASNGRSRRSLKKRSSRKRLMKGGAYDNTKSKFVRKNMVGSPLYELTIARNPDDTVYTLDFSKVGRLASGTLLAMPNKIIINRYSDTFIGAFGIDEDASKESIRQIITELFNGGVAGAKTRKLIITERSSDVDVELQDTAGSTIGTVVTFNKGVPSFEKFLMTLDDALMPID